MTDIKSPQLLYLKGALMLLTGILASVLLISQNPSLQSIALLMIAIWGFCRAYYFAFYVIEHYIDPGYRFAGLTDFLRYSLRKRESGSNTKLHSQSTIEPQDRSIEHRVLKLRGLIRFVTGRISFDGFWPSVPGYREQATSSRRRIRRPSVLQSWAIAVPP
jgi:hypothetical protein